jgi:hypothetical protein
MKSFHDFFKEKIKQTNEWYADEPGRDDFISKAMIADYMKAVDAGDTATAEKEKKDIERSGYKDRLDWAMKVKAKYGHLPDYYMDMDPEKSLDQPKQPTAPATPQKPKGFLQGMFSKFRGS